MRQYSTFEIKDILEMPRERLQDWIQRGFIYPSLNQAKGRGTKNVFSLWDLYGIALFEKLLWLGFSRETAKIFYKIWTTSRKKFTPKSLRMSQKYLVFRTIDKKSTQGSPVNTDNSDFSNENSSPEIFFDIDFKIEDFIEGESDWINVQVFNITKLVREVDEKLKDE